MKSLAVAAFLASLPAALSFPDVTAVPLPDGCASYPSYDADTGVAGPWIVETVNNENTAIEGFGDTSVYSISYNPSTDSKPTIRWGFITFPTRYDIAKTGLRCYNSTLQAWVDTDLTAAGEPTNVQWSTLELSPYPYDASILYKFDDGEPLKIFEHYIDGAKQDGVFLGGYDASTTWGFTYQAADSGSSGQDYYYVRLLGPNSADPSTGAALKANETRGFIKVGM